MPSLKELAAELRKEIESCIGDEAISYQDQVEPMLKKFDELIALVTPTVSRYDYWRRKFCNDAGQSEEDFDVMTDMCLAEEAEAGDTSQPDACIHAVVNVFGLCTKCGVKV